MRKINAKLTTIAPKFFPIAEIDRAKVSALVSHMRAGGAVPPVVVVNYGKEGYMPIDGHHRLSAAEALGQDIQAWVVTGRAFEDLDIRCRDEQAGRAEQYIMCGGVSALDVAP